MKVPEDADMIFKVEIPLHVSGIWTIEWHRDEVESGSRGAGLVLEPTVEAYVKYQNNYNNEVVINGEKIELKNFKVIDRLIESRSRFRIEVFAKARLGYGYGLSAALSIIYSLSKNMFKDVEKCLKLAHISEVKCLTGLGDVIAEVYGGDIEVRLKSGAPKIGKICKVVLRKKIKVLITELEKYYEDTREMLMYRFERIKKYGLKFLNMFIKNPDIENYIYTSYLFSKSIGYIRDDIENFLRSYKRYYVGFYIKKRLLVVIPEKDFELDIKQLLYSKFGNCKVFYTTSNGLRIVSQGFL